MILSATARLLAGQAVVTLKNGDRVTGDIVSESGDRVVVQSTVFGRVELPKDQILKKEDVVSPAASKATNAPAPAQAPAAPAPPTTPAPPPKPPTNTLSGWAAFFPAWLRPMTTNWHGNIQLGVNLGFGTTEQRAFYSNVTLNNQWHRIHDLAEFHSAFGVVNNVESANRLDGGLKTDVDIDAKRRLYLYNQGGGSYDVLQHINLEYHEGVGVGYKVLQRKTLLFGLEAGGQYQHFDYYNVPSKDIISARFGETLTWKPVDKLVITQRLTYLPNIADPADYRVRFDLTTAYPLFGKVTLNLNLFDTYDSRPVSGVHNNDLQIQSTVGYTF